MKFSAVAEKTANKSRGLLFDAAPYRYITAQVLNTFAEIPALQLHIGGLNLIMSKKLTKFQLLL